MAEPYLKGGVWYARVRDAGDRWRDVRMPEAHTKREAQEYQAELAQKYRRQRDGLEPMPPERSFTVGKLLRWWLDTYVAGRTWAGREESRFKLYFETTELVHLPVAALTSARLEVFLQGWALKKMAPASLNKLRAMVRTAWNRARKAAMVTGQNPATDVERRKVPRRAPAFLEPREVAQVLAELSDSDRPIIATALYAGLRKGELFGLRKRDVDFERRQLMVRRSYEQEKTKGGREEAVPIALDLVPYLRAAVDATPGPLLFPRADGSPRTEQDDLRDRLRRAIGRAGLVTGYVHSCRRCKAAAARGEPGRRPHVEEQPDNARRRCPACNMVLWARAVPRPFRLHDTRHTTATLLLAAGVDLYAVARILRHSDPKVTFETYAHLVPGYLHAQIDSLSFGEPEAKDAAAGPAPEAQAARAAAGFAAPVLREDATGPKATGGGSQKGPDSSGVKWRALLDSNQWPSASEAKIAEGCLHSVAGTSRKPRCATGVSAKSGVNFGCGSQRPLVRWLRAKAAPRASRTRPQRCGTLDAVEAVK